MNDFVKAVLEKSYECRPCPAEGSTAAALLSEYEQLKVRFANECRLEEISAFLDVSEKLRQSEHKAMYLGALITGITLHKALSQEHQDSLLALCEQELVQHGYLPGKTE